MRTHESWQRYMSLGVPSAEAPRGHGCIPLELIDVVGFWAPPPEYIPVEISPYETTGYARVGSRVGEPPSLEDALMAAEREALRLKMKRKLDSCSQVFEPAFDRLTFPKTGDDWGEGIGAKIGVPCPGNEDVETDPNGLDPHQPGAKLDVGKNRLGLVMRGFTRALYEVGRVGTYGADKYIPNGWVEVENGKERYMDAAYRHLAEDELSLIDTSTTLFHLAQAAWNLLAVLELRLRALER